MPITLNGDTGIQTPMYNGTITANAVTPVTGFKNRIINGNMSIDQRNAGASVTGNNGTFSVDRWAAEASEASKFTMQQDAGAVTPPVGFTDYLGVTSSSAYTVPSGQVFNIFQRIEGLNISDLAWGSANAKTVTLSFWVRSSLTGTFGGAIQNNGNDRSYPFAFTISAANTWEQKSITIAGDTTGTWLTTNGIGMRVRFSLGAGATASGTAGVWSSSDFRSATGATSVVGVSGATLFLTGVQLEVGSAATSFDYRPIGTELALCQRYYYKQKATGNSQIFAQAYNDSAGVARGTIFFPVSMRTSITALEQSGTAADYSINAAAGAGNCTVVPAFYSGGVYACAVAFNKGSGLTVGQGSMLMSGTSSGANAYLGFSAEL